MMGQSKAFALSYVTTQDIERSGVLTRALTESGDAAVTQARAEEFLARTAAFVDAHDAELKRNVAAVLDGLLKK
ncbi:MAG: hypothetical protein H7840_05480 [Alphaproteobacteria bacterium]